MNDSVLEKLLEPILADHGLELDRLSVVRQGKQRILRITVDGDGPQGKGPVLDDIDSASRSISRALDDADAMGQSPYLLEVSSRGTNAPLIETKHFRRNIGRLVKCVTEEGRVSGRIVSVTDDELVLDQDGTETVLERNKIKKAKVQVVLNPKKSPSDGRKEQ